MLEVNFDTRVGLHVLLVTLNNAAFEAGKSYTAVLSAGTIGSTNVTGRIVGTFRLRPTTDKDANVTQVAGQTVNPISGNVPADVQQWDSSDVIVPTVPGVPEVNTTYVADQLASVASGNSDSNIAAVGGTTVAAA